MSQRQTSTEKARPIALSLLHFRFPMPALASIAHRISGVVLFVSLLPLLWLADMALSSEEGFVSAGAVLSNILLAPLWSLMFASYIYHLCAGIRHLLMDAGIGEELRSGRISAVLVLGIGVASFFASLALLLFS